MIGWIGTKKARRLKSQSAGASDAGGASSSQLSKTSSGRTVNLAQEIISSINALLSAALLLGRAPKVHKAGHTLYDKKPGLSSQGVPITSPYWNRF